ncbi:heat shock protein 70 [Marinomonas sp. MED121]|uniref:hsp70 family protein n=1 Tax=Marinomonas sp. MED121 TaxID=314277 RepID=UPI000068FA54|nr:hsp70 family protein [Marinomonas sp. MED121]EAQ64126.1 heat shock protein 70 [Marinomonas sp. MED121]
MSKPKYFVGIDLGTTNSVVSYREVNEAASISHLLSIPQCMSDASVREFTHLPSAIYLIAKDERSHFKPLLPWSDTSDSDANLIGMGALELGKKRANQLVQSTKSWLSHRQVNRREKILPWGSDSDIKLSPLEASALILQHLKNAWDHRFKEAPLNEQHLALTLPASFDEEARAFTLEAAKSIGLDQLYLIEEPQAACYHWISHPSNLDQLAQKKMLLVVDIGGGTTDFSLVKVQNFNHKVSLHRVAVGNHLLLGGDNLDQALAYQLDPQKISALSASRLAALVQQTRQAKESFLSDDAPQSLSLTVLGGGSRLIGGSQKFEVNRDTLIEQVDQGFFPLVDADQAVNKSSYGVHTLGLPYEKDAAMTRHLAAFLNLHQKAIAEACGEGESVPDAVLFNGGLFNSDRLKQRLLTQLSHWAGKDVFECVGIEPDHAVAKGACIYVSGLANQNSASESLTRIESGVAHSLYLALNGGKYLTLLPKGLAKNQWVALDQEFQVTLGQDVVFPLYRSDDSVLHDAGDLVEQEEGVVFISDLISHLESDQEQQVSVKVRAQLTEIGVLAVELLQVNSTHKWSLNFSTQLNQSGQQSAAKTEALMHKNLGLAEELLTQCFSKMGQKQNPNAIKSLKVDIDKLLGDRDEWNLATSRRLVDKLWSLRSGRLKSASHERQWYQLTGFCMRPGYGADHDEERVGQLFSLSHQAPNHDDAMVWGQYWTLWRRIAAGLNENEQLTLHKKFADYYSPTGQRSREKVKQLTSRSGDDLIRLIGALERLPFETKLTSIEWLSKRLAKSSEPDTAWWTIGRLASQQLVLSESIDALPLNKVKPLVESSLKEDWKKRKQAGLAAVLMTQTNPAQDKELEQLKQKIIKKLKKDKCPAHWALRLEEGQLNKDALNQFIGDSLPIGLSLID